jgi:serine/threonine protein kinase
VFEIFEPGEGKNELYCTMEYTPGEPVLDWCKDEKTDLKIFEVFAKLVTFVKFLHEKGYIHRDIKTGNILVSEIDNPILLDYGLCKDLRAEEMEVTAPGTSLGTPAYSDPLSLLDAGKVAYEADFLPLGRVLWCMLTRGVPDLYGLNAVCDADGNLQYKPDEIQKRFPANKIKDLLARSIFERTQKRDYEDITEIYADTMTALESMRDRERGKNACDFGKCSSRQLAKENRNLHKRVSVLEAERKKIMEIFKEWRNA